MGSCRAKATMSGRDIQALTHITIASTPKTVTKQVFMFFIAKLVVLWLVMVCLLEVEVVGMRLEGLLFISIGMHMPQTCQIWKTQAPKQSWLKSLTLVDLFRTSMSQLVAPVLGGSELSQTRGGRAELNQVTETPGWLMPVCPITEYHSGEWCKTLIH